MRKYLSLLTASLLGSFGTVSQAGLLDHATAGHMQPRPSFVRTRHPNKKPSNGRKAYRTTRSEGVYGRNLRNHFDAHRLTRSQRNRFYAGKVVY